MGTNIGEPFIELDVSALCILVRNILNYKNYTSSNHSNAHVKTRSNWMEFQHCMSPIA